MLAGVGLWCFRHWKITVLGWVLVAACGVVSFGPLVGSSGGQVASNTESGEARELMDAASTDGGSVIAVVDGVDPQAPGVCDAVRRLVGDLDARREIVRGVENPCTAGAGPVVAPAYRSRDGGAFLVTAMLTKIEDSAEAGRGIDTVGERMRQLAGELHAAGYPRARVRVGGAPAFDREFSRILGEDTVRAELLSLPLSLIFLVFVFRGLAAASLPVLTALVSSISAIIMMLGFSLVMPVSTDALTIVTLLGLGLSIDYGLLLVGRYREEAAPRLAPEATATTEVAAGRAFATAGRTIIFSGSTVAASLAGLLVIGVTELASTGAAGVSIGILTMLVSLTFTPALLGAFRRWITPTRPAPRHMDPRAYDVERRLFGQLARAVQRRPGAVAMATALVLLAAGAPLLDTPMRLNGLAGVPGDVESAQVATVLANRFGTAQEPAVTVVARTDEATLGGWARRWAGDPAVAAVRPAERVGPDLAAVQIDVRGDSQSEAAQELVGRLRADRPPGVPSWVAGDAAFLVDVKDQLVHNAPLAIGVTALAIVVLLFLMTGSLIVPIKAVLAGAVSLGATFGIMSAVFGHGYLTGPLDLLQTGGLDPFIQVLVFAFAFGLSLDYEVFLLARIKEYVDLGHDTDTAVRHGLAHTGRIITSAATLMAIVFGCFATGRIGGVEQLGFGLAVAVLVDATIVRYLLVPATMTLMGRWNWWAPAPLRRLHDRIGLREAMPKP